MSDDDFEVWSVVLPALAIAFAAFCVWLAVRIFNRRERWAKRTLAAAVGLPALYVATFGPACWLAAKDEAFERIVSIVYHPVTLIWAYGPEPIQRRLFAYANTGHDVTIAPRLADGPVLLFLRDPSLPTKR
jgi:hypothetical protein